MSAASADNEEKSASSANVKQSEFSLMRIPPLRSYCFLT
jgi:hypothetical protein